MKNEKDIYVFTVCIVRFNWNLVDLVIMASDKGVNYIHKRSLKT